MGPQGQVFDYADAGDAIVNGFLGGFVRGAGVILGVVFLVMVAYLIIGKIIDRRTKKKAGLESAKASKLDPIGTHPHFMGGKANDYRRDMKMAYRMKLAHDTSTDSYFQANVLVTFKHLVEAWEANERAVKVGADNAHGNYMHALNLIEENFGALEAGHRGQAQAEQMQVIERLRQTNEALMCKSELDLS